MVEGARRRRHSAFVIRHSWRGRNAERQRGRWRESSRHQGSWHQGMRRGWRWMLVGLSLCTTPANKFSSRGGGGGGRILWLTPGLDGHVDGVAARSYHAKNGSGAAQAVFKYSSRPNCRGMDSRKLGNGRGSGPPDGTAWRSRPSSDRCSVRLRAVNQWVGENRVDQDRGASAETEARGTKTGVIPSPDSQSAWTVQRPANAFEFSRSSATRNAAWSAI